MARDASSFEATWIRETVRARLFGDASPVKLGRYELRERLGGGAMGVVFAAHDPILERSVALKVLRGADASDAARLMREGRVLARLTHPNVVRIFDAGTQDAHVFLALERVRGVTLDEWLRGSRSGDEIVEVMVAVGSGLAAAHAQGLVHRDVKPRNIFVDEDSHPRLGDFGLARAGEEDLLSSDDTGAPEPPRSSALTQAGAVIGTPAYMAPEQLAGEPVDARADQFAFCVTFFEAISGARPFDADTAEGTLARIAAAKVADVDPEVRWLSSLLLRGLHADPTQRYPGVAALLEAITERHASLRKAQRAVAALDEIGRATPEADLEQLLRRATSCREALDEATASWPDNTVAALASARARTTIEALERARHAAAHDNTLHDRYKHLWALAITLMLAGGFFVFAFFEAQGIYSVGNLELAAFYGVFLALNLVMTFGADRRMHEANEAVRKMSRITTLSYVGHTLCPLLTLAAGAHVSLALAMAHVMATFLWAAGGVTTDARVAVIAPFTALGAIASVLWPEWAFVTAAAVAILGLGSLAIAFRPGAPGLSEAA